MTEAELKEFLDNNKADIEQAIKAKLIGQMLETHRWAITQEVSNVVNEFIVTEIVPEITKYLADNKGPILEAALAGVADIGNTISKRLIERTAKKLAPDSYEFRAVLKALFE